MLAGLASDDPEDFTCRKGEGEYLLYLGRLTERKGVRVAESVAEALAMRHVSLRIVGPALTLAHATVAQFNALVVEPEDDDWHTWLQTGVAGVSNQSRLEALQGALTRAMTAMHLALVSVSVSLEPRVAVTPFRFLRGAFQVRVRVLGWLG